MLTVLSTSSWVVIHPTKIRPSIHGKTSSTSSWRSLVGNDHCPSCGASHSSSSSPSSSSSSAPSSSLIYATSSFSQSSTSSSSSSYPTLTSSSSSPIYIYRTNLFHSRSHSAS